jgi:Ras-related protein Rab-7A
VWDHILSGSPGYRALCLICRSRKVALASHCTKVCIEDVQAAPDDPATFPFVLLGNKCDEPADKRMVSEREAKVWCESHHNMPYLETSAKSDTNVAEAFTAIMELAFSNSKEDPPAAARNLDFSEASRPPPKASCC